MSSRFFILGAILVALIQTLALGKMVYDNRIILKSGTQVVLETRAIDPRDLFRGHYVILNLKLTRPDFTKITVNGPFNRYDPVYIELQKQDETFWTAKALHKTYPTDVTAPVLKAEVSWKRDDQSFTIKLPFTRYYAPKVQAKYLENLRNENRLGVILALNDQGTGLIKGITIDQELLYEEPLF